MTIDPTHISLLALLLSTAMGIFGIYTYQKKAGHDETSALKEENADMKKAIAELKAQMLISEAERNRLTRENYKLMAELLDKRADHVPPPTRAM